MNDLDFSLDAMADDDAPGVVIFVPVRDDAGSFYASPRDAARLVGVSTKALDTALRDGTPVRGMRFYFA